MAGPFVTVRETHIGVVFLIGELAYKLKKPVRTAFLDFSTRQRRLDACRREVELNRRLAPDVYLGVAEVTGVDDHPCDHLVVMRRMPEDRRLATLLGTGAPLADPVRQLARVLAAFHAGARRGPEITAEGGWEPLLAGHLRAAEVRLVLVGGLPGTGKSTVSDALAGAHLHRTARPRGALPGPGGIGRTGRLLEPRRAPRSGRRAGPQRARRAHRAAVHGTTRGGCPTTAGTRRVGLRCR